MQRKDCKIWLIRYANRKRGIFVHYTGIVADGFKGLTEGQKVTFDVIDTEKGTKAVNVKSVTESE